MNRARLRINGDQTQGLMLKENIIHTYSQDNILSCKRGRKFSIMKNVHFLLLISINLYFRFVSVKHA